jgi:IclR family pca regulon transcriptional regulator
MAGLAKGLLILEAFAENSKDRLSIAEVARLTAQTRATARRCLLTLVELGYLDFDGKYFRPLPRLLRLGAAYLANAQLPQMAQSLLDEIKRQVEESVTLTIPENDEMVVIARSSIAQIIFSGSAIGMRVPAYCSAAGRVWLASLTAPELDAYFQRTRLEKHTSATIVDPKAIREAVAGVGEKGYGVGEEELELGTLAIAVPIVSNTGGFVAALAVSTSMARKSLSELIDVALPHLNRTAQVLRGAT